MADSRATLKLDGVADSRRWEFKWAIPVFMSTLNFMLS